MCFKSHQRYIDSLVQYFGISVFNALKIPQYCTKLSIWKTFSNTKSEGFDSCDRPSNLKLDSNRHFFSKCDLGIWLMTSKNNRALLLYYVKLCASFQIHQWIQTGVPVRKRSIRVEIGNILSCVTLKFDGWPWKTIGNLSYAASSFVHHFIAIGEFKLELQSRNTHFGSKSTIFFSRVTLKFEGWLWKTIGHVF